MPVLRRRDGKAQRIRTRVSRAGDRRSKAVRGSKRECPLPELPGSRRSIRHLLFRVVIIPVASARARPSRRNARRLHEGRSPYLCMAGSADGMQTKLIMNGIVENQRQKVERYDAAQ